MIHLLIIHVLDMYLVSYKPVEYGLDARTMFWIRRIAPWKLHVLFSDHDSSPCNRNCTNEILITKNLQTTDHSCVSSGETASSLHTMPQ